MTQTSVEVPDPTTIGGTMTQVTTHFPGWIFGALLVAFGLAMVTIFKPKLARITGLLYAVAEGIALGAISHAYDLQYNGIVAAGGDGHLRRVRLDAVPVRHADRAGHAAVHSHHHRRHHGHHGAVPGLAHRQPVRRRPSTSGTSPPPWASASAC